MLTGVAGLLIPRRGYGWLRRRMVLRRGPGGRPVASRVEETRYPPYVMLNPGSTAGATVVADASARGASEAPPAGDAPTIVDPPEGGGVGAVDPDAQRRPAGQAADWAAAKRAVAEWEAAEDAAAAGGPRPAEEVIEEYVEE
jgi:hypothetical protein